MKGDRSGWCACVIWPERILFAAAVFAASGWLTTGESWGQAAMGGALPTQPAQAAHGPGSNDYVYAGFRMTRHGEGARQFWIFTPDDPQPAQAPLVVFLHGWGGTDPTIYGAWIKHLVRRGNIVVFPKYQADLRTLPSEMTGHAVAAIQGAIARLQSGNSVHPDLDKFALVGHSMGSILCANIAQRASEFNLPQAKAILVAEPAFEPLLGKYDKIPAETLLLIVVGADVKRDSSARRILLGSTQVPLENKNCVALFSDHHGNPPLISDHFAPCAAESLSHSESVLSRDQWRGRTRDALDHYGYWKLCDGLFDAAFFGRNRQYALGNTADQRFMGLWSDGTPAREAQVIDLSEESAMAAR